MASFSQFYSELKRRKVIRVAIAYVVIAWIVVEIASVMFPGLLLPDWSVRLVIAIAIIGFPIALVLAWAVDLTPDGVKLEQKTENAASALPAAPLPQPTTDDSRRSVAVMPFLNLSNDPDNEYFSDGMSEELLNLLCKLPQLTVASRTSSFSFKGKDADIKTVAERLGVDVVLEGSVRRAGSKVRITSQLIDARADRHLWSETYDRELSDVFAVQDEIANNIVKALEIRLSPDQKRLLRKKSTTADMDAYDFYLKGRYFIMRGEMEHALSMFQKAVELDDGFAPAWAGLAEAHTWKCQWIESTPEGLKAADECSLKALELAPGSAEAHAARCFALVLNSKFEEAIAESDKAIELDPKLYEAYYYRGRACFANGLFREAAEFFRKAGEIRPDDMGAATLQSTSTKAFGSEEEKRLAAMHAVEVAERYLALNPDDALAMSRIANDLIYLGEVEKGLDKARRAYRIDSNVCGYNVACAFVSAGEVEQALDYLEEHVDRQGVNIDWIENDSDWDDLREHPRFKALLSRLRQSQGRAP